MNLPSQHALRPRPDAMTRQEVADRLGESYERVYYWTGPEGGPKRARHVVPPSYGESKRQGDPAWFSPSDLEDLERLFQALDYVQNLTSDRRRRQGGGS